MKYIFICLKIIEENEKNIINECSFYLFLEKKDLKIYFKVQKESLKSVNSKQSYVAAKYEKVSFK